MALSPETALKRFNETEQFSSGLTSPKWQAISSSHPLSEQNIFDSVKFENGSPDRYLIHNYTSDLGVSNSWFIAAWVKLTVDALNTETGSIIRLGETANYIDLSKVSYGRTRVYSNALTSGAISNYSYTRLAKNEWHFLVGTGDATDCRVYRDGEYRNVDTSVEELTDLPSVGEIRFSVNVNIEVASVCFGSTKIDLSLIDLLFNGGKGLNYSDLTAQNKTDLGLKAWWGFSEDAASIRADSHGNYDLTPVNDPPKGDGVVPNFVSETDSSIDSNGLLSTGTEASGIDIQAVSGEAFSDFNVASWQANSDGTLTYIQHVGAGHIVTFTPKLSAEGDWIEWVAPWHGHDWSLKPISGTSGKPYLFSYAYNAHIRDYDSSGVTNSIYVPRLERGDRCRLKLISGGQIEFYVNGSLWFSSVNQDWTVDAYELGIYVGYFKYGDNVGAVAYPPRFGGSGIIDGFQIETASACVTENENDLVEGGELIDINPENQPEADGANITTLLNGGSGQDGIVNLAGREMLKFDSVSGAPAVKLDNSVVDFGDIFSEVGDGSSYLVVQRTDANSVLKSLWSEHSSPGYFTHSNGNIYEDLGSNDRPLIAAAGVPDMTKRRLYSIRSGVDFWKVDIDDTNVYSKTSNTPTYETAAFILGVLANLSSGQNAYVFRWLFFPRTLNDAEHEQMVEAHGNRYYLSNGPALASFTLSSLIVGEDAIPTDNSNALTSYKWFINGIERSTSALPNLNKWLTKGKNIIKLIGSNSKGTDEHQIEINYSGKTTEVPGNANPLEFIESLTSGLKIAVRMKVKSVSGESSGWTTTIEDTAE